MPIECEQLLDKPVPMDRCPECGQWPFLPFLRGQVQNRWRRLFHRPYCCLICAGCKQIVGYEKP